MSGGGSSTLAATLRRTAYGINLAIALMAMLTIAVVINYFAHRPGLRLKLDATKTRAYSLSEQTGQLLSSLQGDWTIALIMVQEGADPAMRQQVDEVLRRYQDATDAISVVRVDPTDPETLDEYESLLVKLSEIEADRIRAYEEALDEGVSVFADLQLFAQQQAARLGQVLTRIPTADPARAQFQQRVGLLGLLASEGGQVLDAVAKARRVSESQPIPDFETARSILAQALSQWADELYEMAAIYDRWCQGGQTDAVLLQFAQSVRDEYDSISQRLVIASDPLVRLPSLELSSIGRQLQSGEAALVIGPDRSAVIPSAQLFPRINPRELGSGLVAFDRRFRGEQVISAAIRSLLVEQMPLVVFVHCEEDSLLREREHRADVVGMAALLQSSRFEVKEWSLGNTDRPTGREGQAVAWIVLPPMAREGLEPDRKELALINTVDGLIAQGESVMLNVYPSLLPRYRQTDPWQDVAEPFGLRADTSKVIYEAVQVGSDEYEYQRGLAVQDYPADHPICDALQGQQAFFTLTVPIHPTGVGVDHGIVAEAVPSVHRWLEENWATKLTVGDEVDRGEPFTEPLPIAVAAERASPAGEGVQRFMLVGSGGWMLSYVADSVTQIGAGRVALTNPGNPELMLASAAWLGGMDELIARSHVTRQVERLNGIDGAVAIRWGLIAVLGAPLACLTLGILVWITRRI